MSILFSRSSVIYKVHKVKTPAEKNIFIEFPEKLYSENKLWVPPLLHERKAFLNPKINPFFNHSDVDYLMVLDRYSEPVGRIALFVDHSYNQFHSEKTGYFGFFECINRQEPAALLFAAAKSWCRSKGCEKLVGPMNFSLLHEVGLLVDGFAEHPSIGVPYNLPYYQGLFTDNGMEKEKDFLGLKLCPGKTSDVFKKLAPKIKDRSRITTRPFQMEHFENEVELTRTLYNETFERHWGFYPICFDEFMFMAKEYKYFMDPNLFYFAYADDEPIGFTMGLPDINVIIKKMKGRLLPFGWLKLLMGRSAINSYRWFVWCVKEKYRNLGAVELFMYEICNILEEKNAHAVELTWVLENNNASLDLLTRHAGGVINKRFRVYQHQL